MARCLLWCIYTHHLRPVIWYLYSLRLVSFIKNKLLTCYFSSQLLHGKRSLYIQKVYILYAKPNSDGSSTYIHTIYIYYISLKSLKQACHVVWTSLYIAIRQVIVSIIRPQLVNTLVIVSRLHAKKNSKIAALKLIIFTIWHFWEKVLSFTNLCCS